MCVRAATSLEFRDLTLAWRVLVSYVGGLGVLRVQGWLLLSLLLLLGGGCTRCCHRSSESSDRPRTARVTSARRSKVLSILTPTSCAPLRRGLGDESKERHVAAETRAKCSS